MEIRSPNHETEIFVNCNEHWHTCFVSPGAEKNSFYFFTLHVQVHSKHGNPRQSGKLGSPYVM